MATTYCVGWPLYDSSIKCQQAMANFLKIFWKAPRATVADSTGSDPVYPRLPIQQNAPMRKRGRATLTSRAVRKIERVLVIEPHFPWRTLLLRFLAHHEIACDWTDSGWEALHRLEQQAYDVVITELALPEVTGYALVRYLLEQPWRPMLIVCTRVCEPRLVAHLIEMGVEEVFTKPVLPDIVHAKMQALWPRFIKNRSEAGPWQVKQAVSGLWSGPVAPDHIIRQLCRGSVLPDEESLRLCYQMPILRNILIELANLPCVSSDESPTNDPHQALQRLDPTSLCQLMLGVLILRHLALNTPARFTPARYLDASLAAGLTAYLLEVLCPLPTRIPGLLLASMLAGAGALLLARAFETAYSELLEFCRTTGAGLDRLEQERFGVSSLRLMSWWLSQSGIDLPAVRLLRWLFCPSTVNDLPNHFRDALERIELSRFIAKSAISAWEPYDEFDIPRLSSPKTASLPFLSSVVSSVRRSVETWRWLDKAPASHRRTSVSRNKLLEIAYLPLLKTEEDPFPAFLESLGWQVTSCGANDVAHYKRAITYIPAHRLAVQPALAKFAGKIIVWQAGHAHVLHLPTTIARLASLLEKRSPTPEPPGLTEPVTSTHRHPVLESSPLDSASTTVHTH
ncbi:MAG: hypothetical protein KatS3mg110_1414 [Pirellulaceae bacterium]|nr:MAG: hypothetical protein KatS3mg110_1414 [Pirellulaceae bacterium]